MTQVYHWVIQLACAPERSRARLGDHPLGEGAFSSLGDFRWSSWAPLRHPTSSFPRAFVIPAQAGIHFQTADGYPHIQRLLALGDGVGTG
ncbi:MAG: hypothetical protein ACYCUX_12920 [Metallibacterium sp.]